MFTKEEAKKRALEVLAQVAIHIDNENWEALDKYVERSHAGDGYGDTNDFINFSLEQNPMNNDDCLDIGDMISLIKTSSY